ncbi:Omp28-related outer membrane protein [Paenimyroides viscosum]|uniref:Omp28-related outer membrane protein n=1 Tax=Paenimyroides viscosum TaxID=2488729 RepID=A0A3P1AR69_9FLAO|nr:Omp28-related outer membrane protein [Paenimyroides viscosum]RRA90363.1 hypothetical protein EG242_13635 [Paenimyroides viscosum]
MFKKKFLPVLLLGIASLGIVSCSDSDDSNDQPQNTEVDFTKGEYKQKVLVEDITSASCMVCPLASFTTEELAKSEYADKLIPVAIHDDYNIDYVKDPFVLPKVRDLVRVLKLNGYPFMSWNRNPSIQGQLFQNWLRQGKNDAGETQFFVDINLFKNFYTKYKLFNEGSPIGIKIESNLAATSGKVDVSLKFSQNISQELKYVVYLLEDGLEFKQLNSSPLYGNTTGKARWEENFVHDHVVRATNNFLGDVIASDQTKSSNEYKNTVNLSYELKDVSKASVVVAVLDSKGNVLNVQKAKANTTQDYEKK